MSAASPFRPGIVEGFFGRPWSRQQRLDQADFMAEQGFGGYIYAPKSDEFLRKRWAEPYPAAALDELRALGAHYRRRGLDFGIGLSPFELYLDFNPDSAARLRDKIGQLNECGASLLCLLFDDMRGGLEGLARTQLDIMELALSHSSAERFMLCPTYYSSDPRLSKLFGSPPERYLEELGRNLDPAIGMFWTGPAIISRSYPGEHLREVAEKMRRPPVLWDNYPVNDAERLTRHLHLLPFRDREPELRELCAGLYANPMNQAALSRLPLYTLPRRLDGNADDDRTLFAEACAALCSPELARALKQDAESFQRQGLDGIDALRREALINRYSVLAPEPMALELLDWLRGGYDFDPACLT